MGVFCIHLEPPKYHDRNDGFWDNSQYEEFLSYYIYMV